MKVKIIADSASDLPKDLVEQNNITVLPLVVLDGMNEYKDGVEITPKKIFDDMREGKVYSTSQVPVNDFIDLFTQIAKDKQECFYPAFSSGLSGTYNAAVTALEEVKKSYPEVNIVIIDTWCASMGLGHVVLKACELAVAGLSAQQMTPIVEDYAKKMVHVYTVEKLEYLYRGGRVSKTSALIGDTLGIRPALTVKEGKLVPVHKVRGEKKLYTTMLDMVAQKAGEDLSGKTVTIAHGDDIDNANVLKKMIQERFSCKNVRITTLGAVIGAHAGPGTQAIFVEGIVE
ncbi:MAG: DegV family protein [Eubacteriaceae bacterium]|nr:DegV family protein [Eubacteriaceae bacterium]